jgi:succinoglycan biosynthesis transport protein ExoP
MRLVLAESPGPGFASSPVRGTLNLGLRVLLGLIAGAALAFLIEYLDDSVRSPREAQDVLGLPVLGEIPAA